MAYIEDYIVGIKKDLENVTPNKGHSIVKHSILTQAERLADIAQHNYKFHKNNLMEEIMELAEFHSVDVLIDNYVDKGTDKMIPLEELGIILQKVLEPESTQVYEKEEN